MIDIGYNEEKTDFICNAINLAKDNVQISEEQVRIIKHCRNSVLFDNGTPWIKKDSSGLFEATMGSYDGAETCELVGIYTLHKLANRIRKEDTGLYRDDGLILLREHNGRQIDKARKDITKIFKDIGFNIELKTNLKIVDFLIDCTYRPFKKPDDKYFIIHTHFIQPPTNNYLPIPIVHLP